MGRKPKLYLPLTVTFFEDDRISSASDGAALLYLEMCLYAKRLGTDGVITSRQATRIPRPAWKSELEELAAVGLVEVNDDLLRIAGWLKHNESAEEQENRRAIDRFRKELPDELRRQIYARDGWRCVKCGASDKLSIDHIVPVVMGGTHRPENLQTLCRSCNSSKGARDE